MRDTIERAQQSPRSGEWFCSVTMAGEVKAENSAQIGSTRRCFIFARRWAKGRSTVNESFTVWSIGAGQLGPLRGGGLCAKIEDKENRIRRVSIAAVGSFCRSIPAAVSLLLGHEKKQAVIRLFSSCLILLPCYSSL